MRRRSGVGGEPVKTRRRKAMTLKRGSAPKPVRGRGPSSAKLQEQLDRRTRELREALERQAATAKVLQVISSSTFDLQVVLGALVESAAKLCEADIATIWRPQGPAYRVAATYQTTVAHKEYLANLPIKPGRGSCVGRTLLEAKIVHIPDIREDPEYTLELKLEGKLAGYRTMLGIPLLRQGNPIGVIALVRSTVRPFTDGQIELVTNFAAQAVIAIENARLFEAEQQRTTDLTEALEQQTATSEVLGVISSSPGDLEPVFATMLEKAVRICDAKFGNIYRLDGEGLHLLASHNTPPALVEARRHSPLRPGGNDPIGRMIATKTVIHVSDATADQAYIEHDPGLTAAVELGGARTILTIPMLRENELIGAFTVYRQEVRPFTEKQIALVTNFASQAVIAIENTRLLNELRDSLHSRPPPPKCSRSSAARRSICRPCSTRWSNPQPDYATLNARSSIVPKTGAFTMRRATDIRKTSGNS
jgi:two-component system, NtrC family, sensor kinase